MMNTQQLIRTMRHASVMKSNMQKKGIKAAKAKCPYCTGFWHARLQGRKDHMHMHCDGDCKTFLME
jgi:hypothetical protein